MTADTRKQAADFLSANPYAYLTVWGPCGEYCEGTVRGLSRIFDLPAFEFKTFFTFYAEDGGVEIEATV